MLIILYSQFNYFNFNLELAWQISLLLQHGFFFALLRTLSRVFFFFPRLTHPQMTSKWTCSCTPNTTNIKISKKNTKIWSGICQREQIMRERERTGKVQFGAFFRLLNYFLWKNESETKMSISSSMWQLKSVNDLNKIAQETRNTAN